MAGPAPSSCRLAAGASRDQLTSARRRLNHRAPRDVPHVGGRRRGRAPDARVGSGCEDGPVSSPSAPEPEGLWTPRAAASAGIGGVGARARSTPSSARSRWRSPAPSWCWPAPAPARPARSPTASPTPCSPASTTRDARLAVTFTARAAGEMRHRLAELGVEGVQARTFHSAALRQLRYFWPRVVGGGVPEILPSKARVLGPVLRRAGFTDPSPGARRRQRDRVGEVEPGRGRRLRRRRARAPAASRRAADPARTSPTLYAAYDDRKTAEGFIDFEDVLLLTVGILDTRPDIADEVRRGLPLVHRRRVPGRQPAAAAAARPLARRARRPLRRRRREPDHLHLHRRELVLPRSTSAPASRTPPRCGWCGPTAPRPQVVVARQPRARRRHRSRGPAPARAARHRGPTAPSRGSRRTTTSRPRRPPRLRRSRRLVAAGTPAREIAVLYRINAQSEVFEEALAEAGIAVRAARRVGVLRARRGARGGHPAARCRSRRRAGAGDLGADVRSVLSAMSWSAEPPSGSGAVRERWENLLRLVTPRRRPRRADPAATLAGLVADLDQRAATQAAPAADGVTLATVHAAKGLEWDAVFVVGLVAGHLPDPVRRHPRARSRRSGGCSTSPARARARTWRCRGRAAARAAGAASARRFLDSVAGPSRPSAAGCGRRSCRGSGTAHRRARADAVRPRLPGVRRGAGDRRRVGARPLPHVPGVVRRGAARSAQGLAGARRRSRRSVPAYVVLTDATLEPWPPTFRRTPARCWRIPGIGARKLDAYGDAVLALVRGEEPTRRGVRRPGLRPSRRTFRVPAPRRSGHDMITSRRRLAGETFRRSTRDFRCVTSLRSREGLRRTRGDATPRIAAHTQKEVARMIDDHALDWWPLSRAARGRRRCCRRRRHRRAFMRRQAHRSPSSPARTPTDLSATWAVAPFSATGAWTKRTGTSYDPQSRGSTG